MKALLLTLLITTSAYSHEYLQDRQHRREHDRKVAELEKRIDDLEHAIQLLTREINAIYTTLNKQ